MLLLKNGYVYEPESGWEGLRDILIEEGRIARIAPPGTLPEGAPEDTLDLTGCQVAPGLVDVHAHFRDPGFLYKEDIESGARAAARGGFTTVVLMANTKPAVDREETLRYVLEKGEKTGIHVKSCAAVTCALAGEKLTEMERLADAGAAGFTDDGIPLLREEIAREAMERAQRLGLPVSLHEEDPAYIQTNGIHRGSVSARLGVGGADRQAEISLVRRDIGLAIATGAKVNLQHLSTREAVELVREGKKRCPNLHAEATPHHFTLTQEALLQYGTLAKVNPPLREEADRQAILEGLRDGTIDLIATDHAPHSAEEKARALTQAPSGMIGLETALGLGIASLVRTGVLTMRELLAKMTCNPARLYGLDAGSLREGAPADLVVFRQDETFVAGRYVSRSANSPFTGWTLPGAVRCTICGGRIVYRQEGEDGR